MSKTSEKGFTLIEVLVSLMILGILMVIAVPSMRGYILNNRVYSVSSDFVTSLAFARAEAIRRNSYVSVCSSNANQTACGAATDWTQGWLVFTDPTGGGSLPATTNLIQVEDPLPQGVTFTTGLSVITFTPSGAAQTGSGTYTLNAPGCVDNNGRQINLGVTGRPSITYIACT